MSGWLDDPAAPAAGTRLASLTDIPDGGHVGLEIDGFPVLILRRGDAAVAFVNACPHQDLPLDYRGARVLSDDGKRIVCTNHGAEFLAANGQGVAGHGLGCALEQIPVTVGANGEIVVSARVRD